MTPREELLEALLVERFAPNQHTMFEAAERRVNDDSELATARRRRQLDAAAAPENDRRTA